MGNIGQPCEEELEKVHCFYKIDYEIQEYKEKLKSDFEKLRAFDPDDELRTEDEISEKSFPQPFGGQCILVL